MPTTFYISGLEAVEKELNEYTEKMKAAINEVVDEAVTDINREQKSLAPTYNQELKKHTEFKKTGELQWELFSNMPYSAYMEFGTRSNFQPIQGVDASEYKGTATGAGKSMYESILKWVKDKGVAYGATFSVKTHKRTGNKKKNDEADRKAALAIMRSILIHGVKPHPFFFAPFLKRKQQLQRDVQKAINSI